MLDIEAIQDQAGLAYYVQAGNAGPSEVFAEVFAQLLGGGTDEDFPDLARWFPECASLIRRRVLA